jgi:CDK-activating kinase assembly factor MAT1
LIPFICSREILKLLEEEKNKTQCKTKELTELLQVEKQRKAKMKGELFKAFTGSDKTTDEIMTRMQTLQATTAAAAQKPPKSNQATNGESKPNKPRPGEIKLSSGLTVGVSSRSNGFEEAPAPPVREYPLYAYRRPVVDWCGPDPPEKVSVDRGGKYERLAVFEGPVLAGGFTPEVASMRALQEAMGGLFYVAPKGRRPPLMTENGGQAIGGRGLGAGDGTAVV